MARLVKSPEEALRGIQKFQDHAEDVADRLSHVRAWYACQDSTGKWLFGPSKFIGYHKMTAEVFLDHDNGLDGRKTEACLQDWFEEVSPTSRQGQELHRLLADYLDQYGKAPSRVARINVLTEPSDEIQPGDRVSKVIELIVAIDKMFPVELQKELRKRLG